MTVFDNIGAAFGIGEVTLTLETETKVHSRGEPVRCLVRVFGGKVPQKITVLKVTLRNYRSDGKNFYFTTFDHKTVVDLEKIATGEMREIPLVFHLPDAASLTRKHTSGVRLDVEAKILRGVMRRHGIYLNVEPHRECSVLTAAMNALGFAQKTRFEEAPKQGNIVRGVFDIRRELQDQADRIELFIGVSGVWVEGKMILHVHKSSVGDYLKAAVGLQKQSVTFQIPRSTLQTVSSFANIQNAINSLRDTLAHALILPEHATGWMLRPSQAPEIGKDELLRPVATATPTDAEELLRPHETGDAECPR